MLVDAILKAMNFTFGTIFTEHPTFTWQIVVWTIDCIVFHSDKLKEQIQRQSCHDFNKVSILQSNNNELLKQLKPLVTKNPMEGVV